MNYSEIKYCDIANGEGVRTSLFVSGCTHRCEGCFNPETWDFTAGKPFIELTEQEIIDSIDPSYVDGLTVLGGEPMEPANQPAVAEFLERVKDHDPEKTVWLYTGDVYEDLLDGPRRTEYTDRILACVDVLVDGPYIEEQKNITLRFRGSENQRVIDMNATREAGEVRLWEDDPEFSTHSML